MKLWLLSQDDVCGWDTYDSCVVCAESEEAAKSLHPDGGDARVPATRKYVSCTWTNDPSLVTATYLGEASRDIKEGVVLSSFNAG